MLRGGDDYSHFIHLGVVGWKWTVTMTHRLLTVNEGKVRCRAALSPPAFTSEPSGIF